LNGGDDKNVLVVDDARSIREIITRWMRAEGYACAQAADAETAWRHLEGHDVHLMTLDIRMPGRSGIELLSDVRAASPDTEVIMLTAVGEAQTAIAALNHGASGYLTKPVDRGELLFQANRALERRRLIIENRRYTVHLEEVVREQTQIIHRAHEETIHRLVTASTFRDEETGAHIKRTGLYSEVLARAVGWTDSEAERIRMAAPMHDVGKIGIPDSILQKPQLLTADEYEIMKRHTTIGASMLAGSDSRMLKMAHEIALAHHESWDGSGYPAGLRGPDIPQAARIVAIVDAYDALTHDRVYRRALGEEAVLGILRQGRGSHFDPELLDAFFACLPEMRRIAKENPDDVAPLSSCDRAIEHIQADMEAVEAALATLRSC
jgi:putative two-component system response regulator